LSATAPDRPSRRADCTASDREGYRMRKRTMFFMACAAAMFCGDGCDDQNDAGVSDAATPLTAGDGGMPLPPTPGPPRPVECEHGVIASCGGTVVGLIDRSPIAGASVCVIDHPEIPCVATDANGFYSMECAPVGDAAIGFEAAGYASGM